MLLLPLPISGIRRSARRMVGRLEGGRRRTAVLLLMFSCCCCCTIAIAIDVVERRAPSPFAIFSGHMVGATTF